MIPAPAITEWSRRTPWQSRRQVEQDLVLSRLIVEIANDEYLAGELVFRGGTCFHKLFFPAPHRYSEDLDYVRRTAGGIAPLTRALTSIGERLGMDVATRIGQYPKVFLRAPYEGSADRMRIKIEVNTYERAPAAALHVVRYGVDSSWFTGGADVVTFQPAELVATKLRALYQRSKGRDLFDLWLSLTELDLAPEDILGCFAPYRPERYTSRLAIENLTAKIADPRFRDDLSTMLGVNTTHYDIDAAAEVVIEKLLQRL